MFDRVGEVVVHGRQVGVLGSAAWKFSDQLLETEFSIMSPGTERSHVLLRSLVVQLGHRRFSSSCIISNGHLPALPGPMPSDPSPGAGESSMIMRSIPCSPTFGHPPMPVDTEDPSSVPIHRDPHPTSVRVTQKPHRSSKMAAESLQAADAG